MYSIGRPCAPQDQFARIRKKYTVIWNILHIDICNNYKQWFEHLFSPKFLANLNLNGIPSLSLRLTVFGVKSPQWGSRAASGSARRCLRMDTSLRRRPPFSPPSGGGTDWPGRQVAGSCNRWWIAKMLCAPRLTCPWEHWQSAKIRG